MSGERFGKTSKILRECQIIGFSNDCFYFVLLRRKNSKQSKEELSSVVGLGLGVDVIGAAEAAADVGVILSTSSLS